MENNTAYSLSSSLWLKSTKKVNYPTLTDRHSCDVVIIGGGIVGVTTAMLLQQSGLSVILVEANSLASGASGHTSAKITTQHQLKYSELIKTQKSEKVKLYIEASQLGSKQIKSFIDKYSINCDYEEKTAYVYTKLPENISLLKQEQQIVTKLGLNYKFTTENSSLPFKIAGAISLNNQAQFNPVKYLRSLAVEFTKLGGKIYENSRVEKINMGGHSWVLTDDGLIDTEKIVVASHFPIYDYYYGFTARLHGERSYVVAIKPNSPQLPNGMFITAEKPILSIRTMQYEDETLLLIGGSGHKTGLYNHKENPYQRLINHVTQYYPKLEVVACWSAQDYFTLDTLPYIGRLVPWFRDAFTATGFAKWGMSMGSAAGVILSDIVQNKKSAFTKLFKPKRADYIRQFKPLVKNGVRFVKHRFKNGMNLNTQSLSDIKKGDGAIVNIDGKAVGVYRTKDNEYFGVIPHCSHLGCMLSFNKADKSWDCPCHSSRFTYEGQVIESPARIPLKTVKINNNDTKEN